MTTSYRTFSHGELPDFPRIILHKLWKAKSVSTSGLQFIVEDIRDRLVDVEGQERWMCPDEGHVIRLPFLESRTYLASLRLQSHDQAALWVFYCPFNFFVLILMIWSLNTTELAFVFIYSVIIEVTISYTIVVEKEKGSSRLRAEAVSRVAQENHIKIPHLPQLQAQPIPQITRYWDPTG